MCRAVHLRRHRRAIGIPVIFSTDIYLALRTLGPLHRPTALGHAVRVTVGALEPVALRPSPPVEANRHGRVNHFPLGFRHRNQALNGRPHLISEPLHLAVRVLVIWPDGCQQSLHAHHQISDLILGGRGRCGGLRSGSLFGDGLCITGIDLHLGQAHQTGAADHFHVEVSRLLPGQTARVDNQRGQQPDKVVDHGVFRTTVGHVSDALFVSEERFGQSDGGRPRVEVDGGFGAQRDSMHTPQQSVRRGGPQFFHVLEPWARLLDVPERMVQFLY